MFDLLICGCGGFRPEAEEEELCYSGNGSPESTPTTRRSNNNNNRNADVKNPYATRGLDKYSALLADLDRRRQQIYAKLGSDDHSLVRFVFPEPDHCRPVIVKLREKPTKSPETGLIPTKAIRNPEPSGKNPANIPAASAIPDRCSVSLERLRWPSYYMPVVIIAILLMLTVFGRSVAILCTSFAWYLVPTMHSRTSRRLMRPAKKNKELARTSFELSSPRNNHMNAVSKGGTSRASSPLNRGYRRF